MWNFASLVLQFDLHRMHQSSFIEPANCSLNGWKGHIPSASWWSCQVCLICNPLIPLDCDTRLPCKWDWGQQLSVDSSKWRCIMVTLLLLKKGTCHLTSVLPHFWKWNSKHSLISIESSLQMCKFRSQSQTSECKANKRFYFRWIIYDSWKDIHVSFMISLAWLFLWVSQHPSLHVHSLQKSLNSIDFAQCTCPLAQEQPTAHIEKQHMYPRYG